MDFHRMSCTKLRNFLESKRVEWISENLTLSDIIVIEKRLHECSPESYAKTQKLIRFLKHNIARRK